METSFTRYKYGFHLDISRLHIGFGWFGGERFKLFELIIGEVVDDFVTLFSLQVAYFLISFCIYD